MNMQFTEKKDNEYIKRCTIPALFKSKQIKIANDKRIE